MKRRLSPTAGGEAEIKQEDASGLSEMVAVSSEQLSELIKSVLSRDVLNSIVSQATLAMTPKRFGNVAFGNVEEPHVNAFLHQKLGKDNLSRRAGPRGTKLTYIESCKAIELANQAFGFNGWSCNIIECKEEYREKKNERWSIGFSSVVRIELKDGSSHEDVGFGQADGQPHLGAALEQAKKASISDARKRALRLFGEYLGNSCYDREHIKDVHANKPNLQPSVPIPAPQGRPIDHSPAAVGLPVPTSIPQQPNNALPRPPMQQSPQGPPPASVAARISALQAAEVARQPSGVGPAGSNIVSPGVDNNAAAAARRGPSLPQVANTPAPFVTPTTSASRPPLAGASTTTMSMAHSTVMSRPPMGPAHPQQQQQQLTNQLQQYPHQFQNQPPHQQQQHQFAPRNAPPPSRMGASFNTPIKTEPPRALGGGSEFDINDLSLSQFDYDPTGDDSRGDHGGAGKRMRTL